MLILSLFFLNFLSFGQAGPLVGTLALNKGEISARWNDKIDYVFNVSIVIENINDLKLVVIQQFFSFILFQSLQLSQCVLFSFYINRVQVLNTRLYYVIKQMAFNVRIHEIKSKLLY